MMASAMSQISPSTWSPIGPGAEDELASFLEFGDLPLTFSFDEAPQPGGSLQQEADTAIDTSMRDGTGIISVGDGQLQHQINHPNAMGSISAYGSQFHQMSMPAALFNQHHNSHLQLQVSPYRTPGMIPPTPTSIEMYGDPPRYYSTARDKHPQVLYDPLGTNANDQMTFTPLVSPAVTPLDTQFQYPEFAVPGEYFSPLTSPALEAQKSAGHQSIYGALPRSDTSDTTSPIDMNVEFNAPISAPGSSSVRTSKKKNPSSSKTSNRSVRQSPSMKPQSRKAKVSSAIIPPKEVSGIIQNAQKSTRLTPSSPAAAELVLSGGQDSSESGSISPEPSAPDILMPPPATPRSNSASKSPYLLAQQSGARFMPTAALSGEAATPASLMRICKTQGPDCNLQQQHPCSKAQPNQVDETGRGVEDLVLPAPATAKDVIKPILTPLDTSNANHGQSVPTTASHKVHLPGSLSSPAANSSLLPSPQLPSATSPISASLHKRTDSRNGGGRESKKRNTSVHASPALRPKLSPNIKPLLPEGAIVSAETSALLLASKSNYQNILEGTHLPGVSYPEALSTNLTSKRTSHKIAEQGRRNRINLALQEIASLLPSSPLSSHGTNQVPGRDGGANDSSAATGVIMTGNAAQQSNSKASTVELAIEYIKSLRAELQDVKCKLDTAETKLRQHENADPT